MASNITKFLSAILPKRASKPDGTAKTNTFNPTQTGQILSLPGYRDHLTDIFTDRQSQDARGLMKDLFKFDSDVSASLNAYLTVASTEPRFFCRDPEGNIDREAQKALYQVIRYMANRQDYTTGFLFNNNLETIAEGCRYMLLMRGACAGELLFDKNLLPYDFRHVDMANISFYESKPGKFVPEQETEASSDKVQLDIPNFFIKYYKRNPTEVYSHSTFVSAINTIAARQQVINDLYRIMQKTGYPRIQATVMEEILRKNAPAAMHESEDEMRRWLNARMLDISNDLSDLRADAAYVHTDSVEVGILNEKSPGAGINIDNVVEVLNEQNQAALKTMGTIIGRGNAGVNTASVEARIFSMNADSLNEPIAALFSDMFTMALRLQGLDVTVECRFDPSEMRPHIELEPQKVMKQTRLHKDLSLGLLSDDEYHIMMYNKLGPEGAPILSGTGFADSQPVEVDSVSPNSDPLGRSITPEGSKQAESNENN